MKNYFFLVLIIPTVVSSVTKNHAFHLTNKWYRKI